MDELGELRKKKAFEIAQRQKRKMITEATLELTDVNFLDAVASNSLIVVDCWAPWCGPCRMMGPVVDELAREYYGKIVFGKLNVDDNPNTSAQFGIMSIPTLLVFKGGELVDRITGAMAKGAIESQITKHM